MNNKDVKDAFAANEVFDMELFFQQAADLLCIAGVDGFFRKVNPAVCRHDLQLIFAIKVMSMKIASVNIF